VNCQRVLAIGGRRGREHFRVGKFIRRWGIVGKTHGASSLGRRSERPLGYMLPPFLLVDARPNPRARRCSLQAYWAETPQKTPPDLPIQPFCPLAAGLRRQNRGSFVRSPR